MTELMIDTKLQKMLDDIVQQWVKIGRFRRKEHLVLLVPAGLTMPDYVTIHNKRVRCVVCADIPTITIDEKGTKKGNMYLMRRKDYTRNILHNEGIPMDTTWLA